MATAFGLNSHIGFGEETTYGTSVARTKFLEIMDESLALKQTIIAKPTLRQVSNLNRTQSKKSVEGSIKLQMAYEGLEKILKHAMGAIAAPTGVGPYTHALTLASALPTGLTIEVNRDQPAITGSTAFLYEGCQINKLTLSQGVEDFLMVDLDIIGEDASLSALTSASFTTFNGVDWSHLSTSLLNGSNVKIISWEVTIENGLAADRFKLGQRTRLGLGRASTRKVSGKITFEFEQIAEYNLFVSQTTLVPLSITYNNTLGGANNKQLIFNFLNCALQGDSPKVGSQGPIVMEMSFDAYQSAAQNDEMTVTLINSTSTAQ